MIKIYSLSPGWFFRSSHDRGQEARLYLGWLWLEPAELRLVDCYCSILLRPLEWLFPIARMDGRWVLLGAMVKPRQLRERLRLPHAKACLVVEAGHHVPNTGEFPGGAPAPPDLLIGPVPVVPCSIRWFAKRPPAPKQGTGGYDDDGGQPSEENT